MIVTIIVMFTEFYFIYNIYNVTGQNFIQLTIIF